jgi:8-oxoguanine deaminase
MSTLLLRNADILVTMDAARREIPCGGVFVRDNLIAQVGPSSDLPSTADLVIDAAGLVVLPGLVNTHHHLYQTLTRAISEAQDVELFDWLRVLYEVWGELTDEAAYVSARIGLAELLLSGCTTSSDHLYLYPRDTTLDSTIRAAQSKTRSGYWRIWNA